MLPFFLGWNKFTSLRCARHSPKTISVYTVHVHLLSLYLVLDIVLLNVYRAAKQRMELQYSASEGSEESFVDVSENVEICEVCQKASECHPTQPLNSADQVGK